MREIFFAILIFAGLAVTTVVLRSAEWMTIIYTGVGLILGGLVFSLPCAVWYHVLLYRSLAPRRALDKRWIWNPTSHHSRLTEDERGRVMPWFYLGAAGWVASVAGCGLIGFAALMNRG